MAEAMKFIRQSFYEKALNAELDDYLGYDKHSTHPGQSGALSILTPRDRNGDFELQAIKKCQTI